MKRIDRRKVRPASIVKNIEFSSFFGKYEPERLAAAILNDCVRANSWSPAIKGKKITNPSFKEWLPRFVDAGLLEKNDDRYGVTDTLIALFVQQSKNDSKQNFWRNFTDELLIEVKKRLFQNAPRTPDFEIIGA